MATDDRAPHEQLTEAIDYLLDRISTRASIGIILGSGLGGVADEVTVVQAIPYADIPHLQSPTVLGHRGALASGSLAGRSIVLLQGRLHYFEGYDMWQVTFPVRLLHALGVTKLIVTNAAGGLNPHLGAGDLMLIADHICLPSLAGINPLRGLDEGCGPRFVNMQRPYDPELISLAWAAARAAGIQLHSGIYAMVGGPSYETEAELGLLRAAGADAVGMSTAPEVIVATQLGVKVLGMSCITNHATAHGEAALSHEEVLARSRAAAPKIALLLNKIVAGLPEGV